MMPQTLHRLAAMVLMRGAFHELPAEFGGHYIWRRPERWGPLVEDYLKRLGLPSAAN